MSDPRDPTPSAPLEPARPRVLAVDDQADSRRLLELQLRAAGFHYTMCSDGPSALDLLRSENFDLVILDVMMPQMDGYETCRRIKEDPALRDIPVIFLTAKMETDDKVRGLNAGGHDYLNKPVSQVELAARTRAALRTKALQDDLKRKLQLEKELAALRQERLGEHWERTLGQLATSLAHEINNPLTTALGSIHIILSESQPPPEMKHHLKLADCSLQRAAEKMRHFLRIADSERQPEALRIAEVVRDVLALMNYRIIQEGVRLNLDLDETIVWTGERSELGRIFLYLMGIVVESLPARSSSDPEVALTVKRAGQGAEFQITFDKTTSPKPSTEWPRLNKTAAHRRDTALILSTEAARSLDLRLAASDSGFVVGFPKIGT